MITDYGDITDESFNQTTYEACKAFCEENSLEFNYFKPAGDNTADRVSMIDSAVSEGYNVIVMPGYAFGGAIVDAAPNYPDVKFIALDVAKGDLLEAAVAAKDKAAAEAAYKDASSVIESACSKGVYHKNNAARKVSRLAKLVNGIA